jgi:hypothetical protein
MATLLKQSTAVEIKLGPFLDATDGNTAETGLTIEDEHVDLAKNGGDWGDKNETTTCVHESQGWYRCLLNTTDTDTLGILIVKVHVSGALPVWREFMVVPANVYDSLVAGSDALDVSLIQWLGTAPLALSSQRVQALAAAISDNAITTASINDGAFTAAKFAADFLTAAKVASDVGSEIATAVWAAATRTLSALGFTLGASDLAADTITAAKVAADVHAEAADAVWDEAIAGHAGAGSTGEALSDAGAAGTPPTVGEIADAVWDEDITTHTDPDSAGEALQDAGGAGTPPTAGEVADAVWDEALSGHTTSGSSGERLGRVPNVAAGGNGGLVLADAGGRAKVDVERWQSGTPSALQSGRVDVYLGAVASGVIAAASFASGALDAVWSTTTRLLTAGTNIVLAKGTGVTGFNDPTVGAIADQVWDEAISGHADAGSTGEALSDAGAAGTPPTAGEVADAVWDEGLSGHLGAGSTGLALSGASGAAGSGALTRTLGFTASGNPIQGAAVWVSTDAGGSSIVAGPLITDSFGEVTMLLDAGTYYAWMRKDGFAAIVGQPISVS